MNPINISVVDAEGNINEPEEMTLCPLCDGPMFDYEEVVIGMAFGVKCLMHQYCMECE
jgi:alkyl hydroperoxide reductase subunit AhpF